jgi:hypothetical protein
VLFALVLRVRLFVTLLLEAVVLLFEGRLALLVLAAVAHVVVEGRHVLGELLLVVD